MLTAAVERVSFKRGRRTSAPSLIVLGALMAYVWLLFHSTTYVIVVWRFPETSPHTFEGLESLGRTLGLANALWALLIGAKLVEVSRGPRHARRSCLLPLVLALGVVASLQAFAFLVTEAAHW